MAAAWGPRLGGRGLGDAPAVTKAHPFIVPVIEAIRGAETACTQNDFGVYLECLLKARLLLERRVETFNSFTGDARNAAVGDLLRQIMKKLTGAALEHATALHRTHGTQLTVAPGGASLTLEAPEL